MNIGEAAIASALPAKTIRYYENIGLLTAERRGNGYRSFSEKDVHKLRFLQRSRSLGFSVDECRSLLSLYEDRSRASVEVKRLAENRLAEIDRKIDQLLGMKATLASLIDACHGDQWPECPVFDDLADGPLASSLS